MNNKLNDKIEKIKSEHEQLISLASEQILQGNEDVQNYSSEIFSVLEYDEKNMKKYQATVEAQKLIVSLTEQILNATTVEEIANLRKKINYCIAKIRAELRRRNVSQDVIESYSNQVSSLRKSIAVYVRFVKRGANISEIDRLSANMDNLSKEELTALKKCLQKENRYNKRNLTAYESKDEVVSVKEPEVQTITSEETVMPSDELITMPVEPVITSKETALKPYEPVVMPWESVVMSSKPTLKPKVVSFPLDGTITMLSKPINPFARLRRREIASFLPLPLIRENKLIPISIGTLAVDTDIISNKKKRTYVFEPIGTGNISNYSIKIISKDVPYEETSEYFSESLDQFSRRFHVVRTLGYSQGDFGRNAIHFLRNIPRYIHNKKAIAEMERQCYMYYSGYDFVSFIECMKERNSIQNAIRFILEDSSLTASERASLGEHENCSRWMHDFCAERSAAICGVKRKVS